jgi:hypothetical protein
LRPGTAEAERVEVSKVASDGLGTGRLEREHGRFRASQRDDAVAVGEQFGDHGRADEAGSTGDKDVHAILLIVMRPLSQPIERGRRRPCARIKRDGPDES